MNRIITIALIILMIAIPALGWFQGISPLLSQAAQADDDRENVQSLNDINENRVAALKVKFENIDELTGEVTALRTSIPEDFGIPALLRQINTYSAANKVTLVSVTVGTTEVFAPPVVAAPVVPPVEGEDAPVAEGTDAAAEPVAAGPTFYEAPIQVVVTGTYAEVMAFAGSLQTGPRLYLADSLAVTQNPEGFSATISGTVFALPPLGVAPAAEEPVVEEPVAAG
jgi:Tfp pilus assembly protein PilO